MQENTDQKNSEYGHFSRSEAVKEQYPLDRDDLLRARTKSKKRFREATVQIGVLKSFAICTGKHLCWGLSLIHLQASDLQLY